MSRRVVVLSLDWLRAKDPRTSLGHASILTRLAAEPALDVVPLAAAVNNPEFSREALLATLVAAASGGADLAVGAYVWNEPVVRWLLPALRHAGFGGRIILGGPQITYAPRGVLSLYPEADLAIRGAGEDALAAALLHANPAEIPGVITQGGSDAGLQARADLGTLPSPILTGALTVQGFMRWETQRGCIYECSFCQHRTPARGRRPGVLSEGRIKAEVEALVDGGARDIAVLDPIFHTNPIACDVLGRFGDLGFSGRLSLQSRFELVDDTFLDACESVMVRLEFGLQTIHRAEMRAVRRMNDMGAAERVIEQLHRRDIPFEVSLIYGLPEQTLTSFEASVRWCKDRGVAVIRAFPLMLLRGTGLDEDRSRWGLVENADAIPLVVRSDTFSEGDWRRMRDIAESLSA